MGCVPLVVSHVADKKQDPTHFGAMKDNCLGSHAAEQPSLCPTGVSLPQNNSRTKLEEKRKAVGLSPLRNWQKSERSGKLRQRDPDHRSSPDIPVELVEPCLVRDASMNAKSIKKAERSQLS